MTQDLPETPDHKPDASPRIEERVGGFIGRRPFTSAVAATIAGAAGTRAIQNAFQSPTTKILNRRAEQVREEILTELIRHNFFKIIRLNLLLEAPDVKNSDKIKEKRDKLWKEVRDLYEDTLPTSLSPQSKYSTYNLMNAYYDRLSQAKDWSDSSDAFFNLKEICSVEILLDNDGSFPDMMAREKLNQMPLHERADLAAKVSLRLKHMLDELRPSVPNPNEPNSRFNFGETIKQTFR